MGHLQFEATIGGHEAAKVMVDVDADVASSIARMIGAESSEIARFGSAAEACNAAFWSISMERGQRIVIHDHEYGANAIAFINAAKMRGVVIDWVPSDEDGQMSIDALVMGRSRELCPLSLRDWPDCSVDLRDRQSESSESADELKSRVVCRSRPHGESCRGQRAPPRSGSSRWKLRPMESTVGLGPIHGDVRRSTESP